MAHIHPTFGAAEMGKPALVTVAIATRVRDDTSTAPPTQRRSSAQVARSASNGRRDGRATVRRAFGLTS